MSIGPSEQTREVAALQIESLGHKLVKVTGMETHLSLSLSTIDRVAPKAIIIVAIAKKREARPIINLLGSVLRKSSSA